MATIVCPFCKAYSSFTAIATVALPVGLKQTMGEASVSYQPLLCANTSCGMGVFGVTIAGEILEHWPAHVGGKEFPDVPDHIGAAADEAHRCLSLDPPISVVSVVGSA